MTSTNTAPDEHAIRELIQSWHQATTAGDVDSVLALMTDDVVFLRAGQPPMRGKHAFEAGLRQLLESHRVYSSGEVHELVVSGDLAYAWTNLNVQISAQSGETPTPRAGPTVSILRKGADGAWRIARDANLLPMT